MNEVEYVGFWARFWASVVDTLLLMLIIFPLLYLFYGDDFILYASDFTLLNNAVNYILPFLAILAFWYYKSATPGKMLIHATIVDTTTLEKPSNKQYIIRNLGYLVSFLPLGLGYFWAGWDKKKQTWHDKLADTVVIYPKKSSKPKAIGSYIAIGFGVFAIGAFIFLLLMGFMLQKGTISNGNLYSSKTLPSHVIETLKKQELIEKDETLVYYQSENIFSFTDEATLFSTKRICYFKRDEKGKISIWNYPLHQIVQLKIHHTPLALGIVISTIKIYDNYGNIKFATAVIPPIGTSDSFKKEMMKLWEEARENRGA